MVVASTEITSFIGTFMWPFFRVAALVMTAPVFGARTVPVRIRLGLSFFITLVLMPGLARGPAVDVLGFDSIIITAQQVLIGVVMGFVLQMVLSAVITGGQIVAMQMGLGFAAMVDPQNGTQTPVLSQFYVIMVVLIYLSLNGHLVLFEVLRDSFVTMPVATTGLVPENFWQIIRWGSQIFAGAVGIALPAIASLLIVNFTFGIMTRAAPQLNIFAIGFPITMMFGFALVFTTLPSVLPQITTMFNEAYHLLRNITGGG